MKSRYWTAILVALLTVSVLASLFLLKPGENSARAEVRSDGKLLYVLELSVNQTVTVDSARGTNVVTVRDGRIAVTAADCPDHCCMDRGFCSGGADIVCLPNRLVIRFTGSQGIDGAAG